MNVFRDVLSDLVGHTPIDSVKEEVYANVLGSCVQRYRCDQINRLKDISLKLDTIYLKGQGYLTRSGPLSHYEALKAALRVLRPSWMMMQRVCLRWWNIKNLSPD